jgi:chromosome segregation ATPase
MGTESPTAGSETVAAERRDAQTVTAAIERLVTTLDRNTDLGVAYRDVAAARAIQVTELVTQLTGAQGQLAQRDRQIASLRRELAEAQALVASRDETIADLRAANTAAHDAMRRAKKQLRDNQARLKALSSRRVVRLGLAATHPLRPLMGRRQRG